MGHKYGQPDKGTGSNHNDQALQVVHHKVTVKGSGGVTATVVLTVRRGQIWLSIQPPFTWEAIMAPGKVDELVRKMALATEDAKKMVSRAGGAGDGTSLAGNGTPAPGHNAVARRRGAVMRDDRGLVVESSGLNSDAEQLRSWVTVR